MEITKIFCIFVGQTKHTNNENSTSTGHPLQLTEVKTRIFQGKALFTVKSLSKDIRFTFKIKMAKSKDESGKLNPNLFFVHVLTGPDNYSNYTYLGCIWVDQKTGQKNLKWGARLNQNSLPKSAKFFGLFFDELLKDNLDGRVEVWHEGKCLKCGRRLTTPLSIARGIGPECWMNMRKSTDKKFA